MESELDMVIALNNIETDKEIEMLEVSCESCKELKSKLNQLADALVMCSENMEHSRIPYGDYSGILRAVETARENIAKREAE